MMEVRLVIPYRVKYLLELPVRVRAVSPYDLESVVLDASLQPRITIGTATSGEVIERIEGVVVRDRVIKDAEGFSHTEYALAVKRSLNAFEVHTSDSVEVCEDVRMARADGAFLVACYRDRYASIYLTSFNGLVRHENIYRSRPVKTSIGFQSASVIFEDGRSVILHQDRYAEVGMPLDAIAFLENTFYGYSGWWIVSIDIPSMDIKPGIKAEDIRFAGFLGGLPVFYDGSTFYVLDGGSLIRRSSVVGDVSAWKDFVVADFGERLVIMDAYGKVLADIPKDSVATCRATKHGIVCFRGNLLGVVDFNGKSAVEIYQASSEDHAVEVSSDTTLAVTYGGVEHRVKERQKVLIVDRNASVLKDHFFHLTFKHLLGDEHTYVRSPARRVEVRIGGVRLVTSSAMHKCGGFGVLELGGVEVRKPDRVALEVMSKPLAGEVCLERLELGEIPIEAVDTVTRDRLEVARVRPVVEHVARPQVALSIKHDSSKSVITVSSEGKVVDTRLCCSRVCKDLLINNSLAVEVRDCRLPAWVELTVEKQNFVFHERLDIEVPNLVDAVLNASRTAVFRVGGFYTTVPVPDYLDIPPIHKVRVHVLPSRLVLTFSSRTIGRGVVVAGGRLKSLVIKNGENSFETPFSDKVFLVVDAGRRWLYGVELTPETLVKVAHEHAQLLKRILGGVESWTH